MTWNNLNFLPRNYQPVAGDKHWLFKATSGIEIHSRDLAALFSRAGAINFASAYDLGDRWAEIPAEVAV